MVPVLRLLRKPKVQVINVQRSKAPCTQPATSPPRPQQQPHHSQHPQRPLAPSPHQGHSEQLLTGHEVDLDGPHASWRVVDHIALPPAIAAPQLHRFPNAPHNPHVLDIVKFLLAKSWSDALLRHVFFFAVGPVVAVQQLRGKRKQGGWRVAQAAAGR